ncbi:hypothetical protein PV328_007361 [Microctonus aethiopoides]|uniref:MutL C-terminal dimerisation domain-containing protein n=1 Tax=Microctonus aethiopoides TaxID=144406 RepID=A0AA39F1G2_9HYME|nr:hypothetical protein PV328_007361 [Microctonus aethiopoides]
MEYKMAELNLDYFHCSLVNLVKNAIYSGATSIAIRLNIGYHRIQIIDNGIGFSFDLLQYIGEYDIKKSFSNLNDDNQADYYSISHENYRNIVQNIAASLIIRTKCENTHECYEKIFKKGFLPTIKRISNRPIHGTTLSIHFPDDILSYNFHSSIFANSVEYLAKNYPQISFSIRDDDKMRMSLQIKKKYQKYPMTKNYFLKSNNLFIFPLTLNFKKKMLALEKRTKMKSLFKYPLYSTINHIELSPNIEEEIEKSSKVIEKTNCDSEIIPSQWSDWNLDYSNKTFYSSSYFQPLTKYNIANLNETRRYKFLPAKLTNLLPVYINKKLVNHKMKQIFNTCGVFNYFNNLPRRQDLDVRPCNKIKKLQQSEITLDRDSLKTMEILNQINSEFIASTVLQNGRKLLILIDQHAMHERIRYENLSKEYKNDKNQLISIELQRPINIADIPNNIAELIMKNDELFMNFGLKLTCDKTTNTILIIKTIPKCFRRKKNNSTILTSLIRQLLMEIINRLINGIGLNNLPLTIHNAIASEACHGAIKFGDKLNFHQCNVLVDYWKETNFPNRCAHGRPVIIPLLSIDNKAIFLNNLDEFNE